MSQSNIHFTVLVHGLSPIKWKHSNLMSQSHTGGTKGKNRNYTTKWAFLLLHGLVFWVGFSHLVHNKWYKSQHTFRMGHGVVAYGVVAWTEKKGEESAVTNMTATNEDVASQVGGTVMSQCHTSGTKGKNRNIWPNGLSHLVDWL